MAFDTLRPEAWRSAAGRSCAKASKQPAAIQRKPGRQSVGIARMGEQPPCSPQEPLLRDNKKPPSA